MGRAVRVTLGKRRGIFSAGFSADRYLPVWGMAVFGCVRRRHCAGAALCSTALQCLAAHAVQQASRFGPPSLLVRGQFYPQQDIEFFRCRSAKVTAGDS